MISGVCPRILIFFTGALLNLLVGTGEGGLLAFGSLAISSLTLLLSGLELLGRVTVSLVKGATWRGVVYFDDPIRSF